MIAPGDLDRRLVLEAPVESADGAGGMTRSYQAVATLWASVTPLAAQAVVTADRLAAAATHRIVIRAGRDITTRHRLRDGSRAFRIVAVRDHARPRFIDIRAELITD